ncbi:sigma 54-interacting transcriptional regulator [Acidobacteriota bacterium]
MHIKSNLLVIGEKPDISDLLRSTDIDNSCNIYFCGKQENIFSAIKDNNIKIVVMDIEGDDSWEFKLLKLIKTFDAQIEVVIVGGSGVSENAMEWISLGATDYLVKPLQIESIQLILSRLSEKRELRRETLQLEKKLEKKYMFQGMVGKSLFMLDIFSHIDSISKHFSTVLLTGETGTGKEMVARAIHNLCPTKNRKFVVCDCSTIPEALFESELFGYVKGAFTGADGSKKSMFEEANEGVIFLDEIGEMPLLTQAKLLRIIDTRQFKPLGSNEFKDVDVRVIAATNQDLREKVRLGSFRKDLFHRLNKLEIHLPPLNERPEDILLLARYFLNKYNKKFNTRIKGVSRRVQKFFLKYNWPGNVRELENIIERATMLCKMPFLDIMDLPKHLWEKTEHSNKTSFINKENLCSLKKLEMEYISYIMKTNNKNIRKTAEILDIARSTLYEKIDRYNIQ